MITPGRRLQFASGRYTVRRKLGAGGEGEAFGVTDVHGAPMVLKLYYATTSRLSGDLSSRLQALTLLRLWSRSAVLVGAPREVVDVDGHVGYLSGYAPGVALPAFSKQRPGDLRAAIGAMAALAAGVGFLAELGLAHGDLSPSNVRVDASGDHCRVGLIDLGNAAPPGRPVADGVLGTPGFIAPEMFAPGAAATLESDRFSLAAMIHTALFFREPAAPHLSAMASIGSQARVAARDSWVEESDANAGGMPVATICRELRRLTRRGLARDPRLRPSGVDWYLALRAALERVVCCVSCGIEHVNGEEQRRCAVCGAVPELVLRLVDGGTIPLRYPAVALGRALLGDPHISYEHAIVSWSGFEARVTDLGSGGGTELATGPSWSPLPPHTPHALRPGDRLRFAGRVVGRVG